MTILHGFLYSSPFWGYLAQQQGKCFNMIVQEEPSSCFEKNERGKVISFSRGILTLVNTVRKIFKKAVISSVFLVVVLKVLKTFSLSSY